MTAERVEQVRRNWVVFSLIAALIAGVAIAGSKMDRAEAGEQAAHRPLIIVHGLLGARPGKVLPPVFPEFVDRLKADGWSEKDITVFEYDWTQPNKRTAEQLAAKVEEVRPKTGDPEADKVDIVAHSMGSLSSRYYLKFLGGQDKVKHWVSIGGVNHGTVVPCPKALWKSCADMKRDSEMVRQLNDGDETPGDVRYQTQRSSCDELAIPHSSVPLQGADNRNVGCKEHIYLPKYKEVFETTRDFLLQ
jgi:triacylglycerol lipase